MRFHITANRYQNLFCCMTAMYATINIVLAYLLKGSGLLTFYIIYSTIMVLVLSATKRNRNKVKKTSVIVIAGIILLVVIHLITGLSNSTEILTFVICIVLWMTVANNISGQEVVNWLLNHEKLVIVLQIIYYSALAVSVLYGDGILADVWGTTTLKGPYQINHLLAYELFGLLCMDLVFWIKDESKVLSVFCIINVTLIILTGVRSALIAVVIAIIFAFRQKKPSKKIILIVLGGAALVYAYYKTNLFSGLIEKTLFSAALGSASGGRSRIFSSSLNALFEKHDVMSWLFGIGLTSLTSYNRGHILMTIHAHNDFIDALVQYGIIGLSLYCYILYKVSKKYFIAFLLIFALAATNGFYMYQSIVVLTPILIAFAESAKKRTRGAKRHSNGIFNYLRWKKQTGVN